MRFQWASYGVDHCCFWSDFLSFFGWFVLCDLLVSLGFDGRENVMDSLGRNDIEICPFSDDVSLCVLVCGLMARSKVFGIEMI